MASSKDSTQELHKPFAKCLINSWHATDRSQFLSGQSGTSVLGSASLTSIQNPETFEIFLECLPKALFVFFKLRLETRISVSRIH